MDQNQSAKRTPLVHTIYDFVELFIIALCIVFITFSFAVRFCRVSGPSMENTLYNGEMLLISDLFYTPTAGDVIVFHQTSSGQYNELIVKRIIATEGQFVKVERDAVYVSDDSVFDESDRLDESLYAYMDLGYMLDYYGTQGNVVAVPEGHLFVMGDNRNHSARVALLRSTMRGFSAQRRLISGLRELYGMRASKISITMSTCFKFSVIRRLVFAI